MMGGGLCPPEPPGIFRAWKERHQGEDKNGEAMISDLPAAAEASFLSDYPWAGCVPAEPACVSSEKRENC